MSNRNTLTLNNNNYQIIDDLVIEINNIANINKDAFYNTKENAIINGKEYAFVNNYDNINGDNCIGFWQTLLLNVKFDYANDFNYIITFNNNTYHLIFNAETNYLEAATNPRFTNQENVHKTTTTTLDEIAPSIQKVVVIKTPKQLKLKHSAKIKRIFVINILAWVCAIIAGFGYYFYHNEVRQKLDNELAYWDKKNTTLANQIDILSNKIIPTIDSEIISRHIIFLIALAETEIKIQSEEVLNLHKKELLLKINEIDIPLIRYLGDKYNYQVTSVERNINSGVASITLKQGEM